MKDTIIKKYINQLTIEDIIEFSKKNNISLTKIEATHILYHIKKDWKTVLYSNPKPIFNELKTKINPTTYQKGIELYNIYKEKYQSYL